MKFCLWFFIFSINQRMSYLFVTCVDIGEKQLDYFFGGCGVGSTTFNVNIYKLKKKISVEIYTIQSCG